ncbi:MAG TPA: hypothetical protein VEL74_06135 [Thermoanaerobaculia bacterium]|nr:hypothetical protein [Thermoanaerobaculia bacterium]
MRIIPTKVHGVIDYTWGALLMASPWLFNYARNEEETVVAVAMGAGSIAYSLVTDYEMGAVPMLSMRTHLLIDGAAGLLLAASPWLLRFDDFVRAPHVAFGLLAVVTASLTETRARRRQLPARA